MIQCHRQDLQSDDASRDSAVELVFSCAQLGVEAGRRTGRRVTFKDGGSTDENMGNILWMEEILHQLGTIRYLWNTGNNGIIMGNPFTNWCRISSIHSMGKNMNKRGKTWNTAISKGTARETWWKMMKDDDAFFLCRHQESPISRWNMPKTLQLQRINVEEVNCFLQIWRLTKPMYISRLHCRSIEQVCVLLTLWVHWSGLWCVGFQSLLSKGLKERPKNVKLEAQWLLLFGIDLWSRLDKWWSPAHTGLLWALCFIA